MERGSWGILACINDYHGSSSKGNITTSEMWLYIKKCTTLRCKCKSNKLFCTEVCTCGTEDESCNNLMLDNESIDEDSLSDDI